MSRLKKRMPVFLSAILVLGLILSSSLSAFSMERGASANNADQKAYPIVAITVTSLDAVDALYDETLDLDIFGCEYEDDKYRVTLMVHDNELEVFEANNIRYEVIDDGTYIFEKPVVQSARRFSLSASEGSPIPGLPERENAGPTVNSPLPIPMDTAIETDQVFDPTGVSFNATWGFPDRLGYRTVTEYYAEMNYLAKTYPDLVKLHVYGESYEGVPLFALEISNNPGGNDGRPATLHQAGNHAREWNSNEICMNLAWYLITQYGEVDAVTDLLDTTACWILPMTNPDGVHWDMRTSPGNWRANRNDSYIDTPYNPNNRTSGGVDLNRNYAYGWGSANGSDNYFGDGSFRGSAPFSEPETAAVSEVLRSNMVLSAISGHSFPNGNGQLTVYPWAFFLNTEVDRITDMPARITETVTIKDLGRRQGDYNIHSDEYTSGMYAYSGESLDYKLGALRTLSFLYEYGRTLLPTYMGASEYTATAPYEDKYGKQRAFLVTYPTADSAAGAGAPTSDITAQVAFINAPYDAGYGRGRYTTVDQVNELGSELNGKILVCTRAVSNNDNAAVAIAAQKLGAVAVIMVNENAYPHGYGYNHYNPNLGNGTDDSNNPSLVTIPVAGTSKPYVRELYERLGSDSLTIKSTLTDGMESMVWQFERNIGGFMENMSFATEFASHITGAIHDGSGELLSDATLTLEKEVVSVLIEGNTRANATHDNIFQSGEFRQQQTAVYEVKDGEYDWSVTPSRQLDNPLITESAIPIIDEGYTITATANGRYSDMTNVKVDSYQQTVGGVNFALPAAITTDFAFDAYTNPRQDIVVPFTTYLPDGTPADLPGVTAQINGESVEVVSLGDGKYTTTFNLSDLGIYFVYDCELVIDFAGTEPHSPLVLSGAEIENIDDFQLSTDAYLVKQGEYANITTEFAETIDSNAAMLHYFFDTNLFKYADFHPTDGVQIVSKEATAYGAKVVVMISDYDTQNYGWLAIQAIAPMANGWASVNAIAEYVVRDGADEKEVRSATASTSFTTGDDEWLEGDTNRDGVVDIIDLSNMIDWFGIDNSDSEWNTWYTFFDFNNSKDIDIYDIVYVAQKIK